MKVWVQIAAISMIFFNLLMAGYVALGIQDEDLFRRKIVDWLIGMAIAMAIIVG